MEGTLEGTDARGALAAGDVVAHRYVVIAPLASGGMARLYVAQHLELDTLVALKVPVVASRTLGARLRSEARALAQVRHGSIVRALDLCELDGTKMPCLVMEHLPGHDLAAELALGRRVPTRRALRILRDVAGALDHAHERGIVHRDVKPANVMLTPERAVLVDFGLAYAARERACVDRATIVGTPEYMAPEQALGLGEHVGAAADRYSFAAMALELLAGARPYPALPTGKLLLAIAESAPRRPSDLGFGSSVLDRVFGRALARDPARRFATSSELVHEIRRAMRVECRATLAPADQPTPPTVRVKTPLPSAA